MNYYNSETLDYALYSSSNHKKGVFCTCITVHGQINCAMLILLLGLSQTHLTHCTCSATQYIYSFQRNF